MMYINLGIHEESGGGFAPTDISGCVLWLDASQITGLSDGDSMATWEDLSASGEDAAQGTGGLQPTYKTGIINGLPVARFASSRLENTTLTTLGSGDYHLFVVLKRNGGSSYRTFFSVGYGVAFTPIHSVNPSHNYYTNPIGSGGNVTDGANADATVEIFEARKVSNVTYTKKYGGSESSGTLGDTCTAGFIVGDYWPSGGQPFPGDIGEVILYSDAKTGTDLSDIETYLVDKWGL